MGFFDDVNGPAGVPIINLKENESTRLRVVPAPETTKYAKAKKFFQHSPPREQQDLFGGYCSIMCIGQRNGCIFHGGTFDWGSSMKMPINVIEYELDKSQRPTGVRSIKLWVIGPRIYESIEGQMKLNQIEDISSVDLLLTRRGTKQQTVYSLAITQPLEANIEWNFPNVANGYGDEQIPYLIDYNKAYGFEEMTPAEQQEWLNDRIERGRSKASAPADLSAEQYAFSPQTGAIQAPVTQAAAPFTPGEVPTFGQTIGGNMPRGSAAAAASAAPDYAAIEATLDPWGQGRTFGTLQKHELEYIVNTPGHEAQHVSHAKALLSKPATPPAPPAAVAPPPAPTAPPAAPSAPPPFPSAATNATGASASVGLPAPPTPPAAPAGLPTPPAAGLPTPPAAAPVPVVDPVRAAVETGLQSNVYFANIANVKKFLSVWGVKAVAEANPEQLAQMQTLLSQSADQITSYLGQFPDVA